MSPSEFEEYSRSKDIFGTSFRTYGRKPSPDLNGSFGLGRNFDVGGQTLSVLASASIKTGDETMTNAFYRTYEASSQGNLKSDYNYDSYKQKLDIAALVDIDYTLRESDNIGFTAFFARNASDTHLDRRGFDYQETYDLVGSNQVTHIYTLQNYQLSGHHDLSAWDIDWGASYSLTSSDEPDRRQVMYRRGTDGQLRFFDLNQQETQRYFGSLDENELVADIKATYNFDERRQAALRPHRQGQDPRLQDHEILLQPPGPRRADNGRPQPRRLPELRECQQRPDKHQAKPVRQGPVRRPQPHRGGVRGNRPALRGEMAAQRRTALRGQPPERRLQRRRGGPHPQPRRLRPLPGNQPQVQHRRQEHAQALALAHCHQTLLRRDGPVPLPGELRRSPDKR